MQQFRAGDRVKVIDAGPENEGTVGKSGVVQHNANGFEYDVPVKGIDGRFAEAVKGYRTYAPHQLQKI